MVKLGYKKTDKYICSDKVMKISKFQRCPLSLLKGEVCSNFNQRLLNLFITYSTQ